MQSPLSGIRVVDLTRILAGPFCTMMLSDMGAEVIKVESPGVGDETRTWGPPFRKGESAYFLSVNRGKKSVVVDLKQAEGQELVRRLAERADVLVENYRPGVVRRLGVDYGTLAGRNPRLVYLSISAFGQDGPYHDRAGFDLIAQAMSGIMSITGEPDGPPNKVGVAISDIVAGMWGAYSVASALLARERTGRGQYIDLALVDSSISLLTSLSGSYFMDGRIGTRWGSAHPQITPYQAVRTKDKEIIIGITSDKFWRAFCEVMEVPEWGEDPRFCTLERRQENRAEMLGLIEGRLSAKPAAEWLRRMEEKGIPSGPVYNVGEALEDPNVRQREMVVETDHALLGKWRATGVPPKFSETPGRVQCGAPLHGQHTREVLRGLLELEEAEIAALYGKGVVADPGPRDDFGRPAEEG